MTRSAPSSRHYRRRILWLERLMALAALANFALVLFDLTYLPLRDFWLQGRVKLPGFRIGPYSVEGVRFRVPRPPVTQWYDPIKGIRPHPETQQYLQAVEQLERQIQRTGVKSRPTKQQLVRLRQLSAEIVQGNPFELAGKTATLEAIENRMRDQVGLSAQFGVGSPEQAFRIFWSQAYLSRKGWQQELQFFRNRIEPLAATNYTRGINENGDFIDRFWILDLPFAVLFGLEFLGRTYWIQRQRPALRWREAMLWRWYDLFWFLPVARWLRAIPLTVRLHQARLIDLDGIQEQLSRGFVATIGEELTEVVVVQGINQLQATIRRGDLRSWLAGQGERAYIDLNEIDETAELARLLVRLTVHQVLPQIRPDIEAYLRYNLTKALEQAAGYRQLTALPGMAAMSERTTERLVSQLYALCYEAIEVTTQEDPTAEQILRRLGENLRQAYSSEIQAQQTLEQLQSLLVDLLEEIKINYVRRLSQQDVEELLEQTRQLRRLNESGTGGN